MVAVPGLIGGARGGLSLSRVIWSERTCAHVLDETKSHLMTSKRLSAPPPIDPEERQAALTEACQSAGLPLTSQRRAVLKAVLELDTHPTAEEVHAHLVASRANISRATVFRTLDGLVELGLIGRTCHPGRSVRYDRVTVPHHHLVCLRCNAMQDFVDASLDALPIPDTRTTGFTVRDLRVQVRGLCSGCREKEEREGR